MSVTDVLVKAKALIDTPEKWTKFAVARNAQGRSVKELGPSATCFCSLGAINRAAYQAGDEDRVFEKGATLALGEAIIRAQGEEAKMQNASEARDIVAVYNDQEADHPNIMEAFDRAIEASKAST